MVKVVACGALSTKMNMLIDIYFCRFDDCIVIYEYYWRKISKVRYLHLHHLRDSGFLVIKFTSFFCSFILIGGLLEFGWDSWRKSETGPKRSTETVYQELGTSVEENYRALANVVLERDGLRCFFCLVHWF